MRYYTLDGNKLLCHAVETLPAGLEAMFQSLRMEYTISYYISQWEDEDTAPGQGLDYYNSYGYEREPFRNELVLQNGSFYGFYVGDGLLDPDPRYLLSVSNPFILIEDENRLTCYRRWELIVEPNPSPSEYVFLTHVYRQSENHLFSADEFPEGIAESVSDSFFFENSTGQFDGEFGVTLKLSPSAVADPDAVLKKLQEYDPVLVRT